MTAATPGPAPGAPRTRVYLTVDNECTQERVRGNVARPPLGHDLRIWGRFRNQEAELGVPLLLRELQRTGLAATFFVEALGARFFGEAEHRTLCQAIRDAGQDVQLHLHPVQLRPDWHSRGEPRLSDDIGAYEVERQVALLREGLGVLERCGIDRASLLAFRAGNYGAGNGTWRAMREVGLGVSSSLNLSYLDKNCRILLPVAANALFETEVEGVYELPVSNFVEAGGRYRHLEVTAASLWEMEHYLREARRLGVPEVTIVTHSFEFFFVDSVERARGRPNEVNIRRLRKLLEFLARSSGEFEVETVGALARRLRATPVRAPLRAGPIPRNPPVLRWARQFGQARKRLAAASPFLSF